MKVKFIVALFMTIFILGGCAMNNDNEPKSSSANQEKEFPEVAALQDDFTREFIESVEPTKEGYYQFVSKTGYYVMDFPQDMTISEKSYNIGPDGRSEMLKMIPEKTDNVSLQNQVEFYNFFSSEDESKQTIKDRMGVDLEFEQLKSDFNNQKLSIAEYEYDNVIEIASLITNSSTGQEIQVFSDIVCSDEMNMDQCTDLQKSKKDELINWLKSIELIKNESEN